MLSCVSALINKKKWYMIQFRCVQHNVEIKTAAQFARRSFLQMNRSTVSKTDEDILCRVNNQPSQLFIAYRSTLFDIKISGLPLPFASGITPVITNPIF
ncbi:MAG: hypothetical protein CNIPEHKO_01633 [Anaerolineales bacterium]|nr:hypothetical protein [Anaerolineales bacterium]